VAGSIVWAWVLTIPASALIAALAWWIGRIGVVSPCQSCGACCANYRVSFPCHEVDDLPGGRVPVALVEESTPHVVCMRGTAAAPMPAASLCAAR
jgi:hypothetical protein